MRESEPMMGGCAAIVLAISIIIILLVCFLSSGKVRATDAHTIRTISGPHIRSDPRPNMAFRRVPAVVVPALGSAFARYNEPIRYVIEWPRMGCEAQQLVAVSYLRLGEIMAQPPSPAQPKQVKLWEYAAAAGGLVALVFAAGWNRLRVLGSKRI